MSGRILTRLCPQIARQLKPNLYGVIFQISNASCTNTLKCSSHNLIQNIQQRHFFNDASRTEINGENRIRVYYGMLTPQIRAVKWFSLTTSLLGIISQPLIYNELSKLDNISLVIAGCSAVGFFTFVTPFLLHFVTKKYVTHLDYDTKKDTYIASTVNFFCMLKETEFKPDDVKVPTVPGMFTTLIAKGKPLFMEPRLFSDPVHYSKIMGYDKPIDFKMFQDEDSTSETKK